MSTTNIVTDSQGRTYVGFRQSDGTAFRLYLVRYDGTDVGIWDNGSATFTDNFANGDPIDNGSANAVQSNGLAMAVDGLDRVYLAFIQSDGTNDRLYLTRFDGTDVKIWDNGASTFTDTFTNGDPIDNGTANSVASNSFNDLDIEIDILNRVYIAFRQQRTGGGIQLYLSRFDGTDVKIWDNGASMFTDTFTNGDPIDNGSTNNVTAVNLAIDQSGRAYLPFVQSDGSNERLYLTRFDGTDVKIWDNGASAFTDTFTNGDPIDNGTAADVDVAFWDPVIDSEGNFYVAFGQTFSGQCSLFLTRYDGGDVAIWDHGSSSFTDTFTNGDPIDAQTGSAVQSHIYNLVVDSNDRVYIPFVQSSGGITRLFLSRFNGSDVGIWDNDTDSFTDTFTGGDPIDRGSGALLTNGTISASTELSGSVYLLYAQSVGGNNRLFLTRHTGTSAGAWDNDTNTFTDTFANGDAIDNGLASSIGNSLKSSHLSPSPVNSTLFYAFEKDSEIYLGRISGLPAPAEIDIVGNGVSISDGDTTPSVADHTDFGSHPIDGSPAARTFTIQNIGGLGLYLGGSPKVAVSGANATDFSILTGPITPVPGNSSASFIVHFAPTALGARTALLTIESNDSDEDIYTFSIQGEGIQPEISIRGNGFLICDEDTNPRSADDTNFGNVELEAIEDHTYTIYNNGVSPLTFSGSPLVEVTGSSTFSIITQPSGSVAPGGGTTTFVVRFAPTAVGVATATLTIPNDDGDEGPYNFSIQGTGVPRPDFDGDGNPDDEDSDDDNDGVSDNQEGRDGTNPRDRGSFLELLPTTFCATWNGYLGMENVNEYVNSGARARNLSATLYDFSGIARSETETPVLAETERHLLVHDLLGFSRDSYGRTCTTVANGYPGEIDGRTVFYHPTQDRYDFVLVDPFVRGKRGKQFVLLNTFDPSFGTNDFVANWISVTSEATSNERGTLIFYDQEGQELSSETVFLEAGARRDFSAHQFGPNRVGLVEWQPSSSLAPFQVRATRYFHDNPDGNDPSFRSAIQFQGGYGTGEEIFVPLDTRNGSAVLEFANTADEEVQLATTIRSSTGSIESSPGFDVPPHGTVHLVFDGLLSTELGSVTLRASTSESLIAVGMHYRRNSARELVSVYSLVAREPLGSVLRSSYNTFLEQGCELILLNTTDNEVSSTLTLTRYDGAQVATPDEVSIAPRAVASIDLCSYDTADNYGSVIVTPSVPNSIVGAVIRRGANNRYQAATELRQ